MGDPISIASSGQWSTLLSGTNLVIADFYADWCGPCKVIAPEFERMSREHSRPGKVAFAKINVDTQSTIARTQGVSAMPTFIIFHGGNPIKTVRGANPAELRSQVAASLKLADQGGGGVPGGFAGTGQRLGGEGVTGSRAAAAGRAGGISFDLVGFFRGLVVFVAMYFWTLVSLDPYKAAESFPLRPVRPSTTIRQSQGGTRPAPASGAKPPAAAAFKTLADLGGGD